MKTDLASAIVAAIIGFLVAFFVTNIFFGKIDDFTFKTVETTVNANLEDPNPEVFNYRALNPTVEVYVGSCAEYNANGECVEIVTEESAAAQNGASEPNQENSNGASN